MAASRCFRTVTFTSGANWRDSWRSWACILKINTKRDTTMNRKLIHAISVVSKANPGAPVLLTDLLKRLPGMSKSSFDKAILDLAKSGEYFLTRHFNPGNSTEQEKELMIPDGAGNFFIAINPLIIDRSSGNYGVSPPIEKKRMPRELKPSRPGRSPVPEYLKRVQVRPSYWLPQWLVDWVQAEGDAGKKIEAALIGFYKLKPPS
jgi:hypothetical protein